MSIRKPHVKQVTETPKGEVLLYQSDDGSVRLDVRLTGKIRLNHDSLDERINLMKEQAKLNKKNPKIQ
jgi:hypothetical protein